MSKCKFLYNNQMPTQISALIQLSPLQKTVRNLAVHFYVENDALSKLKYCTEID